MEILPKNSYALSEQGTFDIQEIKEKPAKIDSSIGEYQNEDVTKRYVSCLDLIANSALMGRDKIYDGNTEMILLEQNQASNHGKINNVSRRMFELSDNDSKMILRRQFGEAAERKNLNPPGNTVDYENMEILQKLPPDTIVIRQKTKSDVEDSDYKEVIETNSNSGSSTSGCTNIKMKRISRALRNKTLKTMEVRRNPMRVSKRNINNDFSRPKQRLLTNSKKEFYSDYELGKRVRSSTMPYMNTRSVTRKMYTVGATYQAPTKKDETEWKEWPVHGMHERPVYHPQAGLAVECLGRYFTSFDGSSYCEIVSESDIEVVSVDPHCDRRASSAEKRSKGKARMKSKRPSNTKDTWNTYLSMNNKSFETCMHESLHCVFGYCSQVMTPVYKQAVEEKMTKLMISTGKTNELKGSADIKSDVAISSDNVTKLTEETKLMEAYAIAMAQSIQNKNTVGSTNDQKVVSTFPSSSATYLPEAQKSTAELNSLKTTSQNGGTIRMNLKQIIRGAPNSSLILLRSSAARSTSGDASAATAKNIFNSAKLEDASNDETMMGMSSIYKKLMFTKEPTLKCEESPMNNNAHTLKRYATNTQEYTAKRTFLESPLDKKTVQVMKEAHESKNLDHKMKINRESDGRVSMMSSSKNLAWCTNETSEIARILSEYNKGTLRKATMQNQTYSSRDTKTSLNPNVKNLPKGLWPKSTTGEESQQFVSNPIQTSFDFPQGKWKRLHLMLEKTKDGQIAGGNHNQNAWKSSSTLENRKVPLREQPMNLSTLNYIRKNSIDSRKDLNEHELIMVDVKPKEKKSECSKNETETSKIGSLQELLENTAILYCAANGVHQDDLSNYIDTLDSKQSIQWLETCNNPVV